MYSLELSSTVLEFNIAGPHCAKNMTVYLIHDIPHALLYEVVYK